MSSIKNRMLLYACVCVCVFIMCVEATNDSAVCIQAEH